MNNEIQRKLTSLTLATIMIAGGMTFAFPGFMPDAYAANPNLFVSAEEIGNFAGIQVIEIVIVDPNRDSTSESEGIPNVEINGDDVLMVQGDDGAWYAYVANKLAIDTFDATGSISDIYGQDSILTGTDILSGSDSVAIYNSTDAFLEGSKIISPADSDDKNGSGSVDNNPAVDADDWPFIQAYDISDNTLVTIKYGSGSTAQTTTITYDYDDSKDISFDRTLFPYGSEIIGSLDDSLLNLSPTADDYWAFNSTKIYYFLDDDSLATATEVQDIWESFGFEEGPLTFDGADIFSIQNTTIHDNIGEVSVGQEGLIILRQSDDNDNVFVNYDTTNTVNIIAASDTSITGSAIITYNSAHSIILDTFDAAIAFGSSLIDEWFSGVELDIELIDEDKNLNTRTTEDLLILDGEVPYINIGSPIHLDSTTINTFNATSIDDGTDSKLFGITKGSSDTALIVNGTWPYPTHTNNPYIFSYVNFDFTEMGNSNAKGTFYMGSPDGLISEDALPSGVTLTTDDTDTSNPTYELTISGLDTTTSGNVYFDILSFGQKGAIATNGELNSNVDRVNDAFYRFQLEETDDNTAKFTGTVEYLMINQLNVFLTATYDSIATADDQVVIIVNDDMDGVDAIRISYNDIVSTGNDETISVQEDANTHSGTITMDSTGYSSGNTILITLEDADLNTNSDERQVYKIDNSQNWIGDSDVWLSQLTFNDRNYEGCGTTEYPDQKDIGLNSTSFSFIETSAASGVFTGTLRLPTTYCDSDTTNSTTNGVDIEWIYQDYSDASGNPNETHTSAAVQSNTGSVSLDRTVYGLPFGDNEYAVNPSKDSSSAGFLDATPTTITIQVDDSDYNLSANGEDTLPVSKVQLFVKRGSDSTGNLLASASGSFVETDGKSGIFEYELLIEQGSDSSTTLALGGFIKQGDIISVEYTDDNDASGESNTVTDSATFDLRNAVLQSDKSVYIIGSDAIITLIEPDLNLDSGTEETLSLDLIEWDSDAGTTTLANDIFDAQPAGLRETGPNTGIFQVVIEIPKEVDSGDKLERGEQILLEYVDNGPAGADFVGDDDEDINVTIFTSNFGATITLDQKVYTWTDKVYITVVAPDHNFDKNSIDEIGGVDKVVQINTRAEKIKNYKFVETGPDTGIFTGEVILTGFTHDADGDGDDSDLSPLTSGSGPTDGFIETDDEDGITVSFEFSDNETTTGSALIRWNIGEAQWLEASYPASGTGLVRVIDPDMNLNPESVDSFDVDVWSDSSAGGISLRITETNEATGIFEGTVLFTTTDASSGSRLRVSEGDTVTAEYQDHTLPDPYSTAHELGITATTLIGTIVPPLERAPGANLRVVDAFDNTLDTLRVDAQIQLTADVVNNQDRNQPFAYLVQIQNDQGVTVSLAWLSDTDGLQPGQRLAPALSWVPEEIGTYTATVFIWESVSNPTALSPPLTLELRVIS